MVSDLQRCLHTSSTAPPACSCVSSPLMLFFPWIDPNCTQCTVIVWGLADDCVLISYRSVKTHCNQKDIGWKVHGFCEEFLSLEKEDKITTHDCRRFEGNSNSLGNLFLSDMFANWFLTFFRCGGIAYLTQFLAYFHQHVIGNIASTPISVLLFVVIRHLEGHRPQLPPAFWPFLGADSPNSFAENKPFTLVPWFGEKAPVETLSWKWTASSSTGNNFEAAVCSCAFGIAVMQCSCCYEGAQEYSTLVMCRWESDVWFWYLSRGLTKKSSRFDFPTSKLKDSEWGHR